MILSALVIEQYNFEKCSRLYGHPVFIIQHESSLIKLFKYFEEQVEDFFDVTSDSLVKKTRPSSFKYFNVVGAIPLV